MLNILSFDIEDWFHILDNKATKTEAEWSRFPSRIRGNVLRILEVLDDAQVKGTFFCLGWVARTYPDLVRQIAERGHEIACHSDRHQLVYEMGPERFRADLRAAMASLEDTVGRRIVAYRAPGFSVTAREAPWFFQILGEEGIESDCSIVVGRHGHGGYPRFPASCPCKVRWSGGEIKEFPLAPASLLGAKVIYSGGGYFRLLPYLLIRWLAQHQDSVMTYFHPRDFDPDQPLVPGLSFARRFKSYYGLRTALPKLRRLLANLPFVDLRTAVGSVRWVDAPSVELMHS